MKRIYWFKRKKDNYYFPIDSYIQAADQVKHRNFNQNFEYIGWSDGKAYDEVFKGHSVALTEGNYESQLGSEQHKKRSDLTKKAYLKEIEMAKNNPDKALPTHKAYGMNSSQYTGNQAIRFLGNKMV